MNGEILKTTRTRFLVAVLLGVGLAYIEAAVVVYLRQIFYTGGFTFPLSDQTVDPLWRKFIMIELGRETATLLVLFSGSWLIGRSFSTRLGYFLTLFAVWDIFYYVWLKVLINWPASLMDWDILFLIPGMWAGPVLAPVLISQTMLAMAWIILRRWAQGLSWRMPRLGIMGFVIISGVMIANFCRAGLHVIEVDYQSYFNWPVFLAAELLAIGLFTLCCFKNLKYGVPGECDKIYKG